MLETKRNIIIAGAKTYEKHKGTLLGGSYFSGLPNMYAFPEVAQVLSSTQKLESKSMEYGIRLRYTLDFVEDSFTAISNENFDELNNIIGKINNIHSRFSQINEKNMEEVLFSLMIPVLNGADNIGYKITEEEKNNYCMSWLYLGSLLGIEIDKSLYENDSIYAVCKDKFEALKEKQEWKGKKFNSLYKSLSHRHILLFGKTKHISIKPFKYMLDKLHYQKITGFKQNFIKEQIAKILFKIAVKGSKNINFSKEKESKSGCPFH